MASGTRPLLASTSRSAPPRGLRKYFKLFSRSSDKIYSPALRPAKREVRLMTLVPGLINEQVEVRLATISLDKKPEFETLSYVWGDPNVTQTILLNGHEFLITENLEAALRRLRRIQEGRTLWVDAICVDQQNLAERSSQVSLMADIYGGSRLCTVWLGEEDDDTPRAINLVKSVAKGGHVNTWSCFSAEFRASLEAYWSSGRDLKAFLHTHRGFLKILESLFLKSWWSRTWTVQELVIPKLVVLKCGGHEIDWQYISGACNSLEVHLNGCCRQFLDNLSSQDFKTFLMFRHTTLSLHEMKALNQDVRQNDLIETIADYRDREASDPRDKVYAYLSLCTPETGAKLRADYYADLLDCYSAPTIDNISRHDDLKALGYASQNETVFNLPSWVPDWSTSSNELYTDTQRRLAMYSLFDAAAGTSALFSRQSRTLLLFGIHKGDISATGAASDGSDAGLISALQSWHSLWQGHKKHSSTPNNSEESVIPLLRTIMFDVFNSFQAYEDCPSMIQGALRAESENYDACKLWWDLAHSENSFVPHATLEPGPEAETAKLMSRNLSVSIPYRRFFITTDGFIGIGPTAIEVGDEIWIACGGNMPLVLRPTDETSPSGKASTPRPCHKFVGDCYVDGFMDGEAAEDLMENKVEMRLV